ncbi:hypothetical protein OHA77_06525 [Streptosporangium sp. NBC_01639]|uniref:hypothetical protein n=1 Tax=Streptosporangium sp. NBC_01639 TaxID=2975948 RepID=UPI003864A34C|nr:hypothetical protein OHA77_06525 [Streptosporangium sp. NBC_01639]
MSKVASPHVVVLPAAVRKRLKKLACASPPYRQVVRVKILLAAAGGMRNTAIAAKAGGACGDGLATAEAVLCRR